MNDPRDNQVITITVSADVVGTGTVLLSSLIGKLLSDVALIPFKYPKETNEEYIKNITNMELEKFSDQIRKFHAKHNITIQMAYKIPE